MLRDRRREYVVCVIAESLPASTRMSTVSNPILPADTTPCQAHAATRTGNRQREALRTFFHSSLMRFVLSWIDLLHSGILSNASTEIRSSGLSFWVAA